MREVFWSSVMALLRAPSSRVTATGLKSSADLGGGAEDRAEELLLALDAVDVAVGEAVALADEGDRLIADHLLRRRRAVEAAVAVVDVGDRRRRPVSC